MPNLRVYSAARSAQMYQAGKAAHTHCAAEAGTEMEYLDRMAEVMTAHLATPRAVDWDKVMGELQAAREENQMIVRASQEQTLILIQSMTGLSERINALLQHK